MPNDNNEELTIEQQKKLNKKKKLDQKMNEYAETIGVEDNNKYPRFKEKERLVINMSCSRYFIIRFVAKQLFNFRISFKDINSRDNAAPAFTVDRQAAPPDEEWDIFWTDGQV
jgi:hypothetical protein